MAFRISGGSLHVINYPQIPCECDAPPLENSAQTKFLGDLAARAVDIRDVPQHYGLLGQDMGKEPP